MFRLVIIFSLLASACAAQSQRWTAAQANAWYEKQPWLVGANYNPISAINQLEMWQADSFDPKQIDKELGWAAAIGMNTMRVYLHDLLWQQDAAGFQKRIDSFLRIASKHGIRPMFVLFDSCWDPFPKLGKQRAPKPGVHNSGWVQSPGAGVLADASQHARLEPYVKGVIGAFAKDSRVLGWDLWNEPDNPNTSSYANVELKNKTEIILRLLPRVFEWARAANPTQPLTTGVWQGDWSSHEAMSAMNKLQIDLSDVVSFHSYDDAAEFEKRVKQLQRYGRPLLCTEYLARGNKSLFETVLPLAKQYNVAAINWGLVAGKTQTHLPWDSWQRPYVGREPAVWHHEVFHPDGRPYRKEEADVIRKLTAQTKRKAA